MNNCCDPKKIYVKCDKQPIVQVKSGLCVDKENKIYYITITGDNTSGTIDNKNLQLLLSNKENGIIYKDYIYKLTSIQDNVYYYSLIDYKTGYVKVFELDIETKQWKFYEIEIASQEDVDKIKRILDWAVNKIEDTDKDIADINDKINQLDTDVANVENDITDINTNITNIKNDITTINADITTINNNVTTINDNIKTINTSIEHLTDEVGDIYLELDGKVSSVSTGVGLKTTGTTMQPKIEIDDSVVFVLDCGDSETNID